MLAASINQWIHLLSAVFWVGGLAFIVMNLAPSLRANAPQESTTVLFQNIRRRYYRMSGVFLALLLITGGLNVHFASEEMGSAPQIWIIIMGFKLLLFTAFGSMYLVNLLYRDHPVREGEYAVRFANVSFILGVFIILCAAFLRYFH